ncbi:hypothetical protein UlMin_028692 [Ulmus minor]
MATPTREAIETYMTITGASESLALRTLEEYGGNLNEAVNAHFSGGDIYNANPSPAALPPYTTPSPAAVPPLTNPSPAAFPPLRRDLLNQTGVAGFAARAPPPSPPGAVTGIPISVNSGNEQLHHPGTMPNVRDDHIPAEIDNEQVEDEMYQAAIKASLQETEGSSGIIIPDRKLQQEDEDLARAVSLSLKTAKQEQAVRGQQVKNNSQQLGVYSTEVSEGASSRALNATQLQKELNSSSGAETSQLNKEISDGKMVNEVDSKKRLAAAKKASLPHEPAEDDENAVCLVFRMPNGSRHGRRFLKSDKLKLVFDFIDTHGVVKAGCYRVVRAFPRRAFSLDNSLSTLNELGLTNKQEALFLELI